MENDQLQEIVHREAEAMQAYYDAHHNLLDNLPKPNESEEQAESAIEETAESAREQTAESALEEPMAKFQRRWLEQPTI